MDKTDDQKAKKMFGFSLAEWQRRHRKIREIMQLRDIDCLVVVGCSAKNWAYAASHVYIAGQDWVGLGDYSYVVFPLEGEPIQLQGGGTGRIRNDEDFPIPKIFDVVFKKKKGEGQRIKDYAWGIVQSIKEFGLEKGTIGIVDMRVMPAGVYMEILRELPHAKIVPAGDILLEVRRIKSDEELEYVHKAAECADKGAEAMIEEASRSGATLASIKRACRLGMLKAGASAVDFAIVTLAPWEERMHISKYIMDQDRKVQKGDLIFNEICPNYNGSFVQGCYPISVGVEEKDMPDSFREVFSLHKDIYELARVEMKPGNTIANIEKKINKFASAHGKFGKVWTMQLSEMGEDHYKLNNAELRPRMVYNNHPNVNPADSVPGYRGIMIGNALIVTEGEPEVTSRRPLELAVA